MDKPFVDFYNDLGIMPTQWGHLPIANIRQMREALYFSLGIPMAFLQGRNLVEFGPGGGFNAIPILFYKPARYDFVELTSKSIELLEVNLSKFKNIESSSTVYKLDFLEFTTQKKYCLVIAENCVPGQNEPEMILKHIASFVKARGILVTTSTSRTSLLSEILRKVIADLYVKNIRRETPEIDRTNLINGLVAFFDGHLQSLGALTRTTEDWVLDNLINPFYLRSPVFSIPDVMKTLPDFRFLSSSPVFFQNMNWYKLDSTLASRNKESIESQYANFEILLLDRKMDAESIEKLSKFEIDEILQAVAKCFDAALNYIKSEHHSNLSSLLNYASSLSKLLRGRIDSVAEGLQEFTNFVDQIERRGPNDDFEMVEFKKWWGRGTQYVSLIRLR